MARELNEGLHQGVSNEAILASMLQEAFGLPTNSPYAVHSHHHGVHLNAFTPGMYRFNFLDTFVDEEHFASTFRETMADPVFRRLVHASPRRIRRQLSRAGWYAKYRRGRGLLKRLRELIAPISATPRPYEQQATSDLSVTQCVSNFLRESCGHRFRTDLLSPQPLVIDVGFKYGEFAIPFLKEFGGHVLGVEPSEESVEIALKSLCEQNLSHAVELLPSALWTHANGVEIYEFADRPQSHSVHARGIDGGTFTMVPTVTLSSLLERMDRPVDVLKIDCEGAEWHIFNSLSPDALKNVRQITMELHTELASGHSIDELKEHLQTCGFSVHVDIPWSDPTRPEIWGARETI